MRGGTTVRAVAVAGGGVGALAMAGYGLLRAEATWARRVIGQPFGDAGPDADGWYEPERSAAPGSNTRSIRLALLGDSGAAGLGVESPAETPGARIASGLAALSGRRVRLNSYAVVGARSRELAEQVDRLERHSLQIGLPDVVVIEIGGNDITNQVRIPAAVSELATAVARLRELDIEVVVATCPDLGTIRPVAQPLRLLARRLSRQLAGAQTVAAVSAGARTVSLGDLLGPAFDADPDTLFSHDRFHPSAAGYARMAEVLLPAVCAAVGYAPNDSGLAAVDPVTLSTAAAIAAERAGAEVTPATVAGQHAGPRGTWARIRRRPARVGRLQADTAHHLPLDTWQDGRAAIPTTVGGLDGHAGSR